MIGAIDTRMVPVSAMNPAPYNPRKDLTPSDALYKKLKKSIEADGYIDPIVWNEATGHIVGGHQRFKVLVADGAEEIEAVVINVPDEAEEKRINIELNKAVGDWDLPSLADLLKNLQDSGYDIEQTGFDIPEVDDLFSQVFEKEVHEDAPVHENVPLKPFVEPGDLWRLGKHRLFCGRPDDPDDIREAMGPGFAHMLLAAPNLEDVNQIGALAACRGFLCRGASAYIIHDDRQSLEWRKAFKAADFHLSGVCVWLDGSHADIGTGYVNAHTPVLYGWLPGGNHRWFADRKQTTVWTADSDDGLPTVRLMSYPIKNSAAPRHVVLTVMDHNGSALMACEETGRVCRAVLNDTAEASRLIRRYERSYGATEITVERDGNIYSLDDIKRTGT